MYRLIRVRLALSYAGIALLVTLSLGAVLLVRLRAYYGGMELDYLNGNAKAISVMAAPMLIQKYPKDVQDAQVNNLAFLSQTRVRILDVQKNVLADSGPWQTSKIGLGVVGGEKQLFSADGGGIAIGEKVSRPATGKAGASAPPDGPSSVIVIQKRTISSDTISGSAEYSNQVPLPAGTLRDRPVPGNGRPDISQPDILFFNSEVPVTNSFYGLHLSGPSDAVGSRSDRLVQDPIFDAAGIPLGYVELSQSPAYGREIVNSVASGLAVAGGLAILLAIGAGWLTSRLFTAPLLSLTQATRQMSGGDLSVRVVEAARADEFGILGKSFNQMAGRIEETIQTLRRFLADAAHELQTPLTALRTNLELARSDENSPATENYIINAQEQIERLQRMLKDLIALSRLESAASQEAFQAVNLADLVRQVSEPFAARAEQASQSLELELPAGETLVLGSPEKLCSAVENLLDNALKFTPNGGTVAVRVDESAGSICLTVSDTGIGIPPDEIEMLFNRFHRGRNASSYPGSGLGLAIVRAIAQAHGGSVQAQNNPQAGASFTLCLPGPAAQNDA